MYNTTEVTTEIKPINLCGFMVQGYEPVPLNKVPEAVLRVNAAGETTVDALLYPDTIIEPGVMVLYPAYLGAEPSEHEVIQINERRPATGDWTRAGYHHDWIQFTVNR